jgi:hypothetical protein
MSASYDTTYSFFSPCTDVEDRPCPMTGCDGILEVDDNSEYCPECGYDSTPEYERDND